MHYSLSPTLKFLTHTFNITHSYFSSPITCPLSLKQNYSPFPKDSIFGSLGTVFSHKWTGIGLAHPTSPNDLQQAIHWGRLATTDNPNNLTIIINPDIDWYHNYNPYTTKYTDTHVLYHFQPYTLKYFKPIAPQENQTPKIKQHALQMLCKQQNNPELPNLDQLQQIIPITNNLNISAPHIQNIPNIPTHTKPNRNHNRNQAPKQQTPHLN